MSAEITHFLSRAQQGDLCAENYVLGLVYAKLRSIARFLVSNERPGHTLQATALVNEAFLQKLRVIATPIRSREHYYFLAANAMRQTLVDHARRRGTRRRKLSPENLTELLLRSAAATQVSEDRLAAQIVFRALSEIDPSAAECIQCRFVDGYTISETALLLKRPEWKVRADCDFGLSWMATELGGSR